MRELLQRYFGYDAFRPLQAEIIASVMDGRDTLVLMPTGGGKSLCYQIPALALPGLTLVVSPLIALMKDQVDALKANGVAAECLNSGMTDSERNRVRRMAYDGELKLLYVAPERIVQTGFRRFLESVELSLIAVDEAHCISQWGHEFRPDYRNLKTLRRLAPRVPVIALTATATERVRDDIADQLEMRDHAPFTGGVNRPNLRYEVLQNRDKYDELLERLRNRPGQSAIVYRGSQRGCEELAAELARDGIDALPYHAGLDADLRRRTQERFVRDRVPVIVATVAFGMGIDKPDVRLVVHYDMPDSVERYYQESGRAGRDGLSADCLLFYGAQDRERGIYFIERMENETERRSARAKLEAMLAYCQVAACRRAALLRYFGEEADWDKCDACDVCEAETFDATEIAQKILSAVIRTGQRFGSAYVAQVLTGSRVKTVRERGHDSLSVFGIANDYSQTALREIMATLAGRGLLERADSEFPTLRVTPRGRQFLRDREEISLPVLDGMKRGSQSRASTRSRPADDEAEYDEALFQILRQLRTRLASERGVPPYVIFGDAPLREMARRYPQDERAFLNVRGVGEAKLQDLGPQFIAAIREYAEARNS